MGKLTSSAPSVGLILPKNITSCFTRVAVDEAVYRNDLGGGLPHWLAAFEEILNYVWPVEVERSGQNYQLDVVKQDFLIDASYIPHFQRPFQSGSYHENHDYDGCY